MAQLVLDVAGISKRYGDVEVLRDVSFQVGKGETVCVLGPSGSGKSTLLRCLNGLIPVDRGTIRVGSFNVEKLRRDRDLVPLRHEVSMVFQQYNLFPHRTVLENIVMAPVQVLRQPRDEVKRRAA